MAAGTNDLRSLKGQPFDLLREIERRSKNALAGAAAGDEASIEEWVGIGFRMGAEQFIVDRSSVREVLIVPPALTRVPGARPWIRGLANVRGHLLSLTDLKAFCGGGTGGTERSARVLVANSDDFPVGLVVDEVYGFRRFLEREHAEETPETDLRCERYLDGLYRRGDDCWPVFDMEHLLDSAEFRRAAAD